LPSHSPAPPRHRFQGHPRCSDLMRASCIKSRFACASLVEKGQGRWVACPACPSSNGRAADSTMRPPPTPAAPHGLHQSACNSTDDFFQDDVGSVAGWGAGACGVRCAWGKPGLALPGSVRAQRPLRAHTRGTPSSRSHPRVHPLYDFIGGGLHCARNGWGGESGSSGNPGGRGSLLRSPQSPHYLPVPSWRSRRSHRGARTSCTRTFTGAHACAG
jgi:hypothetical protein